MEDDAMKAKNPAPLQSGHRASRCPLLAAFVESARKSEQIGAGGKEV
jgi:hypothetical protein